MGQTTEAEGFDRPSLLLPGAQQQLLRSVLAGDGVQEVILVLVNGGPVDVSTAVQSKTVTAIIETFQPGELGGDAMIAILDGSQSPSGKMPYTTYFENYTTSRDIREVNLQAGRGTTYMWMRDPVLFPFGAGIEFTQFEYTWSNEPPSSAVHKTTVLTIPSGGGGSGAPQDLAALSIEHTVTVSNVGARASPVVVLAFIVAIAGSPTGTPIKKLFGFERLNLVAPGQNSTVSFVSDAKSLGVIDAMGAKQLMAGHYRIEIGSVTNPAICQLELRGPNVVVEENHWVASMVTRRKQTNK